MLPLLKRHSINLSLSLLAGMLGPRILTAQATHDSPTLTLGISAGWTQGTDFWRVRNQPIVAPSVQGVAQYDIFDIHRQLTGNLIFGFQATMYKSPNLGFTGEVSYVGIGTKDSCILATATGYTPNRDACNALDRSARSASATNFIAGVVVRPWSRSLVQPFVTARAGFSAVSDNLVAITSYTDSLQVEIYPTAGGLSLRPTGTIGLGLATNFGVGYQFRIEARETWVGLTTVTGPSAHDEIAPPTGTVYKRLGSLQIGFDVILEKSPGRRY